MAVARTDIDEPGGIPARAILKIVIAHGPVCPHCGEDGFDDWHHEPSLKVVGISLSGRLKCHGCGKFFSVEQYGDGQVHSTAMSARP